MTGATLVLPNDGTKEMLLIDDIEIKEFLRGLLEAMTDGSPETGETIIGGVYGVHQGYERES